MKKRMSKILAVTLSTVLVGSLFPFTILGDSPISEQKQEKTTPNIYDKYKGYEKYIPEELKGISTFSLTEEQSNILHDFDSNVQTCEKFIQSTPQEKLSDLVYGDGTPVTYDNYKDKIFNRESYAILDNSIQVRESRQPLYLSPENFKDGGLRAAIAKALGLEKYVSPSDDFSHFDISKQCEQTVMLRLQAINEFDLFNVYSLDGISNFKRVTSLSMDCFRGLPTGESWKDLSNMSTLVNLSIVNGQLISFTLFKSLPNLKNLNFRETDYNYKNDIGRNALLKDLNFVEFTPNLISLTINMSEFTYDGEYTKLNWSKLKELPKLEFLELLSVYGARWLSEQELREIYKDLPANNIRPIRFTEKGSLSLTGNGGYDESTIRKRKTKILQSYGYELFKDSNLTVEGIVDSPRNGLTTYLVAPRTSVTLDFPNKVSKQYQGLDSVDFSNDVRNSIRTNDTGLSVSDLVINGDLTTTGTVGDKGVKTATVSISPNKIAKYKLANSKGNVRLEITKADGNITVDTPNTSTVYGDTRQLGILFEVPSLANPIQLSVDIIINGNKVKTVQLTTGTRQLIELPKLRVGEHTVKVVFNGNQNINPII